MRLRDIFLAAAFAAICVSTVGTAGAQDVRPPASAQIPSAQVTGDATSNPPPAIVSNPSITAGWGDIQDGTTGTVSIPDKKAGRLIQTNGMEWLSWRNTDLYWYGAYGFAGMIVLLGLFLLVRGRIRVEHGLSGRLIQRFKIHEVVGHWLTAGSFILLALTGLNLMYGRQLLLPIMGPDAFAAMTIGGKYLHNFGGFAFMLGLLWIFVVWVRENLWDRYDFNWILKGGGFFSRNSHPPADKFNFGQKVVFWSVIGTGFFISVSGVTLLMPFWWIDNIEQMQTVQIIHAALGVAMFIVILAHIYIGSVGMEHAFSAMKTGWVDINWAKEHHSVWVDRYVRENRPERYDASGADKASGEPRPAE